MQIRIFIIMYYFFIHAYNNNNIQAYNNIQADSRLLGYFSFSTVLKKRRSALHYK
jgi:hypothetical protein